MRAGNTLCAHSYEFPAIKYHSKIARRNSIFVKWRLARRAFVEAKLRDHSKFGRMRLLFAKETFSKRRSERKKNFLEKFINDAIFAFLGKWRGKGRGGYSLSLPPPLSLVEFFDPSDFFLFSFPSPPLLGSPPRFTAILPCIVLPSFLPAPLGLVSRVARPQSRSLNRLNEYTSVSRRNVVHGFEP